MSLPRIAALQLRSRDPEHLAAFYVAAFDCRTESAAPDIAAFDLGAQRVECLRTSAASHQVYPSASTGFQHFAIIVSDMDRAMVRLRAVEGWTPISTHGPEQLPPASGGARAFKFRDPEGHPLEFLAFAADRTPPAWASADGRLFKGIDHTAISVSESDRSIAFYKAYGFDVASRQINRGIEQERMDAVPGAVVEVTGLMIAGAPPHLELLCYREPGPVRTTLPGDDILATRILWQGVLSPGPDHADDNRQVLDPDGHRLLLV